MKPTIQRPFPLPPSVSRPVVSPLMPAVVYASDNPDQLDQQYEGDAFGYTYAREGHPNADIVARTIAAMEGVDNGIMTGSGMAAVTAAVLGLCQSGDHVLGGAQLYGRSLRMLNEDLPRLGIETSLADPTDAGSVRNALQPNTRMVLIETVSNPTLRIADLTGIAALCAERGILLAVDNTFTTPAMIKPFDLGADIVIHSVTKLLAGHADVTLGWVGSKHANLEARMRVFAVTTGMTASPFDCWLAERGLASFGLRFERSQASAAQLADWLADQPGIERVLYPVRPDHPDHNRTMSLMNGQGGNIVSFSLKGGRGAANAFASAASGVAFAPTLGDVGTTLSHAASSSHRVMAPEAREAQGITEGFFRVSVGLENPEALIETFSSGLKAAIATL